MKATRKKKTAKDALEEILKEPGVLRQEYQGNPLPPVPPLTTPGQLHNIFEKLRSNKRPRRTRGAAGPGRVVGPAADRFEGLLGKPELFQVKHWLEEGLVLYKYFESYYKPSVEKTARNLFDDAKKAVRRAKELAQELKNA